jgi:hypothetical protein
MKKLLFVLILGLGLYNFITNNSALIPSANKDVTAKEQILANVYKNGQSDIQVKGSGKVTRILADDNKGSRHQKFIVTLSTGQAILIAHNIDLAPKINSLRKGDYVEFYGEYEYNPKGGVVHWTHKDPRGHHENGWLKHKGKIYR